MKLSDTSDVRAHIPSISKIVDQIQNYWSGEALPHPLAVRLARLVAGTMRSERLTECSPDLIQRIMEPLVRPGPRRVINATGILLHTNLGRAPLDTRTLAEALEQVRGYTDLEFDIGSGKRRHRDHHFAALARLVWGVEDATLVNNAAAAVALSLAALGEHRETVVSRGELIEIGGSFRLPDIMNMAGTRLVEIGTTNKTKLGDYEQAIGKQTACLLKTHPSNYRVEGFTAEVPLADLAALGREVGVPVVMDLGSGLSRSLPFPPVAEPFLEDYLEADPDLLIFSGDKLFGSVQGGLVLGKRDAVAKLRKHPLMRMLRADKLTISVICHQLRGTVLGKRNPLADLARADLKYLEKRARRILGKCPNLKADIRETPAYLGGGSLPQEARPGLAMVFNVPKASKIASALRLGDPSVIGYIRDGAYTLNLYSVFPDQDEALIQALQINYH